jgi:peroxiredoxin
MKTPVSKPTGVFCSKPKDIMRNIIALLFTILSFKGHAQEDSATAAYIQTLRERMHAIPGKQMNTFDAVSLSGTRFNEASFKGKVTLINFWFEACAPCIAETKELNELYEHFRDKPNFQFLSFTFDPVEQIKRFVEKNRVSYPVIRLEKEQIRKLNFDFGYPVTLLVDTSGTIRYFKPGGSTNSEIVKEYFKKEVYPRLTKLIEHN